jgi:hypothetical protein
MQTLLATTADRLCWQLQLRAHHTCNTIRGQAWMHFVEHESLFIQQWTAFQQRDGGDKRQYDVADKYISARNT